jgi:uncharacterized protein DUF4440/uncharacterized protein DUF3471/molybdopterin-dependent oxidoreductase-like protein protein
VTARGHGGEEHSYAGVALGDLLRDAGMPGGADLHGRYLRYYALAQAADHYSVVFALPELDPAYMDKTVLVAWARDGQPLPADEGPLAIVVPDDKHPARWVRQLRRVDVHIDGAYSFPTEPDLEKITQELLDAVTRGDKDPWLLYLADECILTTEDGQTLTKKELVDQIHPLPAGYSGTLKMADPKVRSYGMTAVISYDALETETIYGQELKTRYHTTDTYLFRFGHWRMIASQGMAVHQDPPLAQVDPKVYDAYAGTYELAPGVTYTVTREGAKLFGQRAGGARQELLPEAEDRFFLHGARGVKIFVRDPNGRAVRLLDRRDGNDLVWKRRPG